MGKALHAIEAAGRSKPDRPDRRASHSGEHGQEEKGRVEGPMVRRSLSIKGRTGTIDDG
jgi:hypothetical protein